MEFIKNLKYLDFNLFLIILDDKFVKSYHDLIKLFCNKQDIAYLENYVFNKDKYQHLASIILQKYVTKEFFNNQISYPELIINRTNKPFIKMSNNKLFNYNVSHDEDIIIICYDNMYKIGIDIMYNKKEKELENIKNLYVNNLENKINKLKLWTLIESYYKSDGVGLLYFNNRNFYFYQDNGEIKIYDKNNNKLNTKIYSFTFNNYTISICKKLF